MIHILHRRIVCVVLALLGLLYLVNQSQGGDRIVSISGQTHTQAQSESGNGKEKEKDTTSEHSEHVDLPCTVINPLTNQFYDLRQLSAIEGDDGHLLAQAWNSKGFDYGHNFSIGICSSPIRQMGALTALDFPDVTNKSTVGGYYTNERGNKVSIGSYSTDLKIRGMNLVLEYGDGDVCESSPELHKSTLLTFKCDREMMSKARVSYLGSMANCSYFFEVRTVHACATSNEETETAIWGIFAVIVASAVGVYLFAGAMYKLLRAHYEHMDAKGRSIV